MGSDTPKQVTGIVRICRDEDCPNCGWPETFTEVDFDAETLAVLAIGCSKCEWRNDSSAR